MNRQEANETLYANLEKMDLREMGIEADEIAEAVEVLKAPDWISVKDSLPEDGERVLVTECGRVFVERFDRLLGFDTPTTHWMPLPEPPKEESNE